MDLRSTVLVVGGSLCAFKLFNKIVRYLPTPERACEKKWKWRNTLTSLAHSSLTGAWAVICLYHQPQMLEDLISSHSLLSHSLVAVSTGYFIHDFLDVGFNLPLKQTWEVLLHHSTVISFTLSLCLSVRPTVCLFSQLTKREKQYYTAFICLCMYKSSTSLLSYIIGNIHSNSSVTIISQNCYWYFNFQS
ncbi:TLC domain-containing protein 2-like isoform X2 [Xyrichtys novacula]|uniref:TLC domain-containing protein 2-like isoform X2 n=1 Tax=Xyrichtys novacula TaxID=13765 RepID=A0AAV1FSI1_XYRNO|nr:TLC domain-containing protein 2-like isoform X2 [Xyrichtys novacula]